MRMREVRPLRCVVPAAILLLWLVIASLSCRKTETTAGAPSASASISLPAPLPPPASSASAEPAASPAFLWRFDGSAPRYLFGSIHVPDPRLAPIEARMRDLAASSDLVLTEIPMDPATQVRMSPLLMLPKGKTLKDVVPADVHARVERAFVSRGLPFGPLSTLKPWVIGAQVALIDRLLVMATREPLDAVIFNAAKAAEGLETPEEQVAGLDSLTRAEQTHLLASTLDLLDKYRKEGLDPVEQLLAPYVDGDALRLYAAVRESYDPSNPVDAKVVKRLFDDRNVRFAQRIDARLRREEGKSIVVAIGAGHLIGPGSVVELLGKKGWKLERVR